jgi:hypothetical protein
LRYVAVDVGEGRSVFHVPVVARRPLGDIHEEVVVQLAGIAVVSRAELIMCGPAGCLITEADRV